KFKPTKNGIFRLNAGTGLRVVNLFTEEHAALTGARNVIVAETLKPERSYNVNLNYMTKNFTKSGVIIGLDASVWYTHVNNIILPDYDTNPNQIIYDNLDGKVISKGVSLNVDAMFFNGIKLLAGVTFQDVSKTENGITERQMLTESFTGTWAASY